MNHNRYVACVMVASLAISGGSLAVISASASNHPAADVEILLNGVPQRRYIHDGRWYVEALKGREYAIRLRNPYPVRVAIALSVDGLNTIDARETTATDARKWVLGPHETVIIGGWQTSRTQARRFEFTTEDRSYGRALGRTTNLGVITAVFFKERVPVITHYASNEQRRQDSVSTPSPSAEQGSAAARANQKADNEYAATGMGRGTDHTVEYVSLDLEDAPATTVNIRYELRPQLVRLGILPPAHATDPLQRRERARGFDPEFSPELSPP